MTDCPFCNIKKPGRIYYRDELVIAFLSKDAISEGQSLVVPKRHISTISQLNEDELSKIFSIASKISKSLIDEFNADGTNIICNNGNAAGQNISHFHVHVIPRKKGDIPNATYWLNPILYNKLYKPTIEEFEKGANIMKSSLNKYFINSEDSNQNYGMNSGWFKKNNVTIGKNVYLGQNIRIYPNVFIGNDCIIDDNVIIGYPGPQIFKQYFRRKNNREKNINKCFTTETKIGEGCIIRSGTIVYSGVRIGNNLDTGHNVLIREGSEIGNNVYILPGTQVHANVKIGNNVRLFGFLSNHSVVKDGASMLGYLVHNYKRGIGGIKEKAPLICEGAIVGMGAVVIGGCVVGKNAIVGANAVVKKDVPENKTVVGEPAKEIIYDK